MELEFRILIDPLAKSVIENALTFETGATREQASNPELHVYEHHGSEFGQADPGALSSFFEDLILGRPMPLVFTTHAIKDVDTLFAIALFLHRELAIQPGIAGIVAQVDLVHRRGLPVLGHLGEDFARFLRLLRAYFPHGLSQSEIGTRLTMAVGWIREHILHGEFPALGKPFAEAKILDRATDGFVVAETSGDLLEAWVGVFAKGHLRGIMFSPEFTGGRRRVLCARKSFFCSFGLPMAAKLLNEVETAMGEPPEWRVEGDWLWGPSQGTTILVQHILGVLVRV